MTASRDCRRKVLGTGIILDSLVAYRAAERPALNALLGLDMSPQVIGIAPESPAERAGLAVGDHIIAIDGLSAMDLMSRKGGRDALPENILENIGDMAPAGPLRFEVERSGKRLTMDVHAIALCQGMVALKHSGKADAFSDRNRIAVTTGLASKLTTPDEMAFIIGHELAHIIFEDSISRKMSRLKKENRADLYGVRLAACAGFKAEGAISALEKLRQSRQGIVISGTHGSFRQRQHNIKSFLTSPMQCERFFR